jgi:hypothetical protein
MYTHISTYIDKNENRYISVYLVDNVGIMIRNIDPSELSFDRVNTYAYTYVCICMHIFIFTYVYTCIDRNKDISLYIPG